MICHCSYGRKLFLRSIYKFFNIIFTKIFSSLISERQITQLAKK